MATSSIFANFNITDSKKAEDFVKALDISAKESSQKVSMDKNAFVVLQSDIRNLWDKRKAKK
ncbi:MAG: hypothetical protein IKO57_14535 [Treponema sp.]|nr:hypothetical protein [Treponema sp.]MBR4631634.1 hypothetical protein [Treponema sp.]